MDLLREMREVPKAAQWPVLDEGQPVPDVHAELQGWRRRAPAVGHEWVETARSKLLVGNFRTLLVLWDGARKYILKLDWDQDYTDIA